MEGIGRHALDVLQQIPGLQVDMVAGGCCGMSGGYGFKKEKCRSPGHWNYEVETARMAFLTNALVTCTL